MMEADDFLTKFCEYKAPSKSLCRDAEEIFGFVSELLTFSFCKRVIGKIEGM